MHNIEKYIKTLRAGVPFTCPTLIGSVCPGPAVAVLPGPQVSSQDIKQIDLDINRSFPNHITVMFWDYFGVG